MHNGRDRPYSTNRLFKQQGPLGHQRISFAALRLGENLFSFAAQHSPCGIKSEILMQQLFHRAVRRSLSLSKCLEIGASRVGFINNKKTQFSSKNLTVFRRELGEWMVASIYPRRCLGLNYTGPLGLKCIYPQSGSRLPNVSAIFNHPSTDHTPHIINLTSHPRLPQKRNQHPSSNCRANYPRNIACHAILQDVIRFVILQR